MNSKYLSLDVFLDEAFSILNENTTSKYPPYNIVKLGDDKNLVELAVAGFAPEDLSVSVENNKLIVSGKITQHEEAEELNVEPNYVYKGIGRRAFTREFKLHEYMQVVESNLKNGILSITIETVIPEEKKPRKVDINVK